VVEDEEPDTHVVKVLHLPKDTLAAVQQPARNLLLATVAAQYGEHIVLGGMADDHCPDKTPAAFRVMQDALNHLVMGTAQDGAYRVLSPFWHLSKADAVAQYLADGGAPDTLLRTHSCYRQWTKAGHGCGQCAACFRWRVALRANGLDVAAPGETITTEYLAKLHTYERGRVWTILRAIATRWHPVVAWDIDGVLTLETAGHDYAARTPDLARIGRLREQHTAGAWVVLHSSRREVDRGVTENWLNAHGVPYHALLLEKPPVAWQVDDRAGLQCPVLWTGQ
jgi:7-cyano-7-deazaguanine synthase in queuosine biosynthesis